MRVAQKILTTLTLQSTNVFMLNLSCSAKSLYGGKCYFSSLRSPHEYDQQQQHQQQQQQQQADRDNKPEEYERINADANEQMHTGTNAPWVFLGTLLLGSMGFAYVAGGDASNNVSLESVPVDDLPFLSSSNSPTSPQIKR
jgi:hypothetical protein